MSTSTAVKLARVDRRIPPADREQRFLLPCVTWKQYLTLRKTFDHVRGLRMTYLEGTLEIMTPSREHELIKTMTARLLEAYAEEKDIPLNGFGSTTYRRKAKERGLEPDECYCVGSEKKVPDIALEVVISSGGIDRLAVYEGLEVPEVWFWIHSKFRIHQLGAGGYAVRARSCFLTHLDPEMLIPYLRRADQTAAVRDFRRALRKA